MSVTQIRVRRAPPDIRGAINELMAEDTGVLNFQQIVYRLLDAGHAPTDDEARIALWEWEHDREASAI